MKTIANYLLSFAVGLAMLTLWTVLPPPLYFGLLAVGGLAVVMGQNSEDNSPK